jgi:dienelactone hydrolase
VRISPNGRFIAAVRTGANGSDEIVVADWRSRHVDVIRTAAPNTRAVYPWVRWKNDDRLIFAEGALRTSSGATFASGQIMTMNAQGQAVATMFGGRTNQIVAGAPVGLIDTLPSDPNHVLLAAYGARAFTLYRADVITGAAVAVDDADWSTFGMVIDVDGQAVLREDALPYGSGVRFYRRASGQRTWTLAYEAHRLASFGDNREFVPIAAGPGPGEVYVAARPAGRDYQAIYLYDTASGQLGEPVFQVDNADAEIAWIDNSRRIVVGCGEIQRQQCRALDAQMQSHFEALRRYFPDVVDISLVDAQGDLWLLYVSGPTVPGEYAMYERSAAHVTILSSPYPALRNAALRPTTIVPFRSRDGTALWGYLTSPPGAGPHALVVMPHGGPEMRDSYSYDFFVQFLASRGYSVFQPNFRGSEGSGRSFVVAGRRQWGRRMQDDITDGVHALIQTGAADASRICILGSSYGGYAALAGITLTPSLYRCAISIAGVSDLPRMLDWVRHTYNARIGAYDYWTTLIGDPATMGDELIAVSPARHAAQVRAPLLLIHGDADSVVPIEQSNMMNEAMRGSGRPVQLVTFEGEGHSWPSWAGRDLISMMQKVQDFLDQNIGPSAPAPAPPAQSSTP